MSTNRLKAKIQMFHSFTQNRDAHPTHEMRLRIHRFLCDNSVNFTQGTNMTESNTLMIRDARADERDATVAVTLAAYEQYAAFMPSFAWEMYRAEIVETVTHPDNGDHIVAEWAGEIVGSVLLISPEHEPLDSIGPETSDVPEVRLLAVTPPARGHGVGKALMEECIRRVRQAGFPSITLHTHEMMAVAMRMYEKMGFARAPELDFSPMEGALIKGYRMEL
jgi:GNAT superfamily N-acetyltransferase